jgi:uncharacterized glyoxalase superfamily protein PhnB
MAWSPVIPTLRCQDARAEITFLRDAFGFRVQAVYPEQEDQPVMHAELSFGSGMVMLGAQTDGSDGRLVADTGPNWTYVIVDDVAAHHGRAVEAGAEIVQEPKDEEYGGSGYTARDPEGNLWSFGSYTPAGG